MKMGMIHGSDKILQHKLQSGRGGRRATMFVYVMIALETMAFLSNGVSLVTYFYGYMNFSLTKSATALTNFMGTSFLLSLFGGFISDTYLSRFMTCIVFASFEIIGFMMLGVQAHVKVLRPIPCKDATMNECESASSRQEAMLFAGLYLVALGTGGIKAALPSLGADQFEERDPKEAAALSSFFNWYMFSLTLGAIFGVTFVVWISTNQGWDWSFGVSALAVALAILFLCMGRSLFRSNKPTTTTSPLLRILQVFIVAIRNWNLPLPETAQLHEIHDKEAGNHEILHKTDQFKFLDQAAIVRSSEDSNGGSWKLCTITQVEETKILIRMLPIILSTVFMNTCLAQLQTFSIQQSTTMDRNVGSFEMPGPSIPVIPLAFMFLLLPLYDRFFVPLARRLTTIPTGITHLQRVGVGLVLSIISMAISGVIETHRKSAAVKHGTSISVFWLGIQYAIFGMADMFTVVGLMEFFYAESSAGMKSLGMAVSWCSLAFGYYTSTVVVNVVNRVSGGWLASNDLNADRLEYFYWLLAGLSVVNFGVYLQCASWYKYKKVQVGKADGTTACGDYVEERIDRSVGGDSTPYNV